MSLVSLKLVVPLLLVTHGPRHSGPGCQSSVYFSTRTGQGFYEDRGEDVFRWDGTQCWHLYHCGGTDQSIVKRADLYDSSRELKLIHNEVQAAP